MNVRKRIKKLFRHRKLREVAGFPMSSLNQERENENVFIRIGTFTMTFDSDTYSHAGRRWQTRFSIAWCDGSNLHYGENGGEVIKATKALRGLLNEQLEVEFPNIVWTTTQKPEYQDILTIQEACQFKVSRVLEDYARFKVYQRMEQGK